ncbi:MAG TPA: helicase-related protein [Polyangiaceae bacterium]|nr:helicase-related protein [Polyangiaceae bacterium]
MHRTTVTALLGPTNTGKTHRAIARMLEHETGAIALPLRLLAREVYDRVSAAVGEDRVALVTGEERRVPRAPSYWVSTCEAMDTEREVDFVAVDEVQLAADRDRGHVFTDRILHARGRRETHFLGSHAAREVLARLVPHAVFEPVTRLSRLTHAGSVAAKKLPARSAMIAFSMSEVYELAERAKARGGAAVVLGALSPRARNAQVAMFQAGEVETLVATDAIGMGLNLDLRHVAFAKLRKFDGRAVRDVDIGELCQIAGRAGRYVTDGTFGGLAPLALPLELAHAIEHHAVPPIRRVRFRARPSFGSLAELRASLAERSHAMPWLLPAAEVDDTRALEQLAARAEVRARATSEERVRLLWTVCSIPDFRKLLFDSHASLLTELYLALCERGPVDDAFLDARFGELADAQGDVDTLVARIAQARLLAYVSHRADLVRDARGWQERARAWEDRLSDALHLALVARFVVAGAKVSRGPSARASRSRPRAADDELEPPRRVDGPFAALGALRVRAAPLASSVAAGESIVERAIAAPFDAFALSPRGVVALEGRELARLVKGRTLLAPGVRLTLDEELRGGARLRLERRLAAHARDLAGYFVRALRPLPADASRPLRGLVFRLDEGLGALDVSEAQAEIAALDAASRDYLFTRGVRARGGYWIADATPAGRKIRAALVFAFAGALAPEGDPEQLPRRALPRGVSPALLGYFRAGDTLVRGDLFLEGAEPEPPAE